MRQEEISSINDGFERYRDRITNFSHEFEFGLFIHIVRRSLPIILAILLLSGLGAYLYLRYTVPIYNSNAVLQLEKNDQAQQILQVGDYMDGNELSSDVELLLSEFMLSKTLANMGLEVRYFEEGRVRNSDHYGKSGYDVELLETLDSSQVKGKRFFVRFMSNGTYNVLLENQEFGPFRLADRASVGPITFRIISGNPDLLREDEPSYTRYFTLSSHTDLVNEFKEGIQARVLNGTAKTILISYDHPNPILARDLVMKHVHTFLDYDWERKEQSSKKVLGFIESQLDTVSENLRNAEFLLNSFKKEYKMPNLSNLSGVYMDRLNDYENDLFEIELQKNLLEEVSGIGDEEMKNLDIYNLISLLAGSEFESILGGLLGDLQKLLRSKEEIYFNVTENSEYVEALDYQINIQKNLIVESVNSLQHKLQKKEELLRAKSRTIESSFQDLPSKELEFARYERLFNINEKYYTILLEKKIEYRISKAGFVTDNKVLSKSVISSSPISPVSKLMYGGFLGFGVLISILFVIIRYLLHNNITSLNEIAKLSESSIGILGMIPKYKENIPVSQLIIGNKPKSLIAESFRTIRTNLQFVDNTEGSKVIAITSTISSEGKTFVALNLAGILAISDKKVILIDLDMRKPKIHKGFNAPNDKGMSTLLIGKESIEDCIQHSNLEGLDFITAGPIPPNPSELTLGPAMKEVISLLKEKYDVVVIDNPPVGLVTDGITAIQMADYPIYIFRADYSKKHFVQNVDRLINENGISKLSVILNGVELDRNKYGYYYGYGYGYGYAYGKGYGNGYYNELDDPSFWSKIKSLWKSKKRA